ncbi:conserved repeat domain protein [Methanobacterium lacus]|uniref:Conserved repeat domain protein n=2 Tax=Methanobacterium lacus (strain AL-21) TaxID=877455 RepID=F0TBM1_METLA|nr:conserved repeat domain protein [Methanobacterium lacus]
MKGVCDINKTNKIILFLLTVAFVIAICGTASAATVHNNTTISHSNNSQVQTLKLTSANAKKTSSKGDPIITGTVTINRYGTGTYYALKGATITVNSTSGRVLGTTTTDQNGNYYINFYSTDTSFLVTCSFLGCNSTTNTVPVTLNNTDKLYYGSSNFQLRPNSARLTSTGTGTNVKIKNGSTSDFAGVINVDINGVSYQAYCIDLYTNIAIGNSLFVNGPLPGTNGDLNSQIDWGKVNYIIKNYSPTTDTEAAAMQCAIWYFTSVQYGAYPGNDSSHTDRYQYMTNSADGITSGGGTAVRTRALQMISAATSVQYPTNIDIQPGNIRVENGKTTTLTATVTDKNGNPLSGINVNFYTNKGSLSITSGVTNSLGQISTILSGITSSSATVYAMVNGTYGTLLYDNPANPLQNLVAVNAIPYTFSDSSTVNFDVRSDVQLSQTSTTPVNVGDTYTYVVKAHNNGPNAASGILISDVIPAGLTNYTITPSVGTFINGVWTIPTLANGGNATLTITGTVLSSMAGTTNTNTATITGQDQYNNYLNTISSADVYTKKSVLSITNSAANGNVNVGDTGKFTITIYNSGPDAASNIQLTDILPAGYAATWTAGNYANNIWTINSLASGSTATLTFTGAITSAMAGKTTTNHATVTWAEYPKTVTISDSTIYVKDAEVALSQTTSGTNVNVGDTVTYTVKATNNGPDTATNIIITDAIPSGLNNVIVSPSVGTYSNGVWTIPYLANQDTATLTITGKASASMAGKNTTNTATRTSQTEYNSESPSVSAKVYTKMGDPILTQTVNGQSSGKITVNVNDILTIVVYAKNIGPDSVHNVNILDLLPIGMSITDITPSVGTFDMDSGIWFIPLLDSGDNETLTINGYAETTMAGNTVNNTATELNQTEYNPYPGNSTSIPIYTKLANVIIKQTGSYSGKNVKFIITAYNNGPDSATNILIGDIVPDNLSNYKIVPSIGTYIDGVWTIPELDSLEYATLTITGSGNIGTTIKNIALRIGQTEYNSESGYSELKVYISSVNLSVTNYPWKSGVYTYDYKQQIVMLAQINNLGNTVATGIKMTYKIGNAFKVVSYNLISPGTLTFDPTTNTFTLVVDRLAGGLNTSKGSFAGFSVLLESLKTGSGTSDFSLVSTIVSSDQTNTGTTTKTRNLIINPAADIQVTQTTDKPSPNVGDYITITINATNNGPNSATGINITDLLPAGLYLNTDSDPNTYFTTTQGTYNPITGLWTVGNLNNATTATLTIIARVTSNSGMSFTNYAYKTGTSPQYDWNTGNDADTTIFTVDEAPS